MRLTRGLIGVALLLAAAGWSNAEPLPIPEELSPGDQYQVAFLTSTYTNAISSDINYYNDFVQDLADAAGIGSSIGVTWKAIASTPTVHAIDNALVFFPVYDMTSRMVAYNASDMWDGHIEAPINITEHGLPYGVGVTAWTGTKNNGLRNPDHPLGAPTCGIGNAFLGGSSWIDTYHENYNYEENKLYALSSPVTVPIPEPSTLVLLCMGAIGLLTYAWRRRCD